MGDGGMVLSNDDQLADRVRLLRTHGYRPKYYNSVVGGNFRLDALQAAILRVKLGYLERWTAARRHHAATYCQLLGESGLVAQATDEPPSSSLVQLPHDAGHGRHVYNQFVIRSPQRDELRHHLSGRHIGSEIYYPVPMHLQQCFAELGYGTGDFPHAERAAAETLALPVYPELSEAQIGSVVAAIGEFCAEAVGE